jgi:hypothetical protein
MGAADEFLEHPGFGRPVDSIENVLKQWDAEQKSYSGDDITGMTAMLAVLGADAVTGDRLLNQISPELLQAFAHLEGEKADTYEEVRAILAEKLALGDASVLGLVNKVKGQVGEDKFVETFDHSALVESRNQEAVDAFIASSNGSLRYVQVKMYADPNKVVEHMLEVQHKVADGQILVDGNLADAVDFAVPADIADAVREKAANHPELLGMNILPLPTTASEVGDVVMDAANNVAHPVLHLAQDALGSVMTVAALDLLTNTYMVAAGKRSATEAGQHAVINTSISTVGVVTSKGVALLVSKTAAVSHPIALPILAAIAARSLAKRWYSGREDFIERLRSESDWLDVLIAAFKDKELRAT